MYRPPAPNLTVNIHQELERFYPYWRTQSGDAGPWGKHILAVKWSPMQDPATRVDPQASLRCPHDGRRGIGGCRSVFNILEGAPPRGEVTPAAGLPPSYVAQGVRSVQWAVLMMFRPFCLWPLSHNAREQREHSLTDWAKHELSYGLESLVVAHARLTRQHVPVLVVSCTPPCAARTPGSQIVDRSTEEDRYPRLSGFASGQTLSCCGIPKALRRA
jgi:hypothetical protein